MGSDIWQLKACRDELRFCYIFGDNGGGCTTSVMDSSAFERSRFVLFSVKTRFMFDPFLFIIFLLSRNGCVCVFRRPSWKTSYPYSKRNFGWYININLPPLCTFIFFGVKTRIHDGLVREKWKGAGTWKVAMSCISRVKIILRKR